MTFDLNGKSKYLYLSHLVDKRITIWDPKNENLIRIIEVHGPWSIYFNNDFIYVTSSNSFVQGGISKKVDDKIEDSDGIFIIQKSDFKIINKIQFDNWSSPSGLYLDKHSNIITVAVEKSKWFIFIIDGNNFNSILNKIDLGLREISTICDITFLNDTMIICYDESSTKKNLLKLIKFK